MEGDDHVFGWPIILSFILSPAPVGMLYVLYRSNLETYSIVHKLEPEPGLSRSAEVGLFLADMLKWSILIIGVIDLVTNRGVNMPIIATAYLACAAASFISIYSASSN